MYPMLISIPWIERSSGVVCDIGPGILWIEYLVFIALTYTGYK